jgi:hypothetical protein
MAPCINNRVGSNLIYTEYDLEFVNFPAKHRVYTHMVLANPIYVLRNFNFKNKSRSGRAYSFVDAEKGRAKRQP